MRTKMICRNHEFRNRLTMVRKRGEVYIFFHEIDIKGREIQETPKLRDAFETENWTMLEQIEADDIA